MNNSAFAFSVLFSSIDSIKPFTQKSSPFPFPFAVAFDLMNIIRYHLEKAGLWPQELEEASLRQVIIRQEMEQDKNEVFGIAQSADMMWRMSNWFLYKQERKELKKQLPYEGRLWGIRGNSPGRLKYPQNRTSNRKQVDCQRLKSFRSHIREPP